MHKGTCVKIHQEIDVIAEEILQKCEIGSRQLKMKKERNLINSYLENAAR